MIARLSVTTSGLGSLAAHAGHRLLHGHAFDFHAVELGDEIAGQKTGARSGCVFDRGHDLDRVVLELHVDTQAAELAFEVGLPGAERLAVQV